MASLAELPLKYRLLLRAYRWRRLEPVPWAPLRVPLARARVALVTSAGLYRTGRDEPFHEERGGDHTMRWIGADERVGELTVGQTSDSFDRGAIERDPEGAFPLGLLHALAAEGAIGAVAPRHVSFNGSQTAPGRFVAQTAPQVAGQLVKDAVDAALLVPV